MGGNFAPKYAANLVFYATSNYKDLIDRHGDRPQTPPIQQLDAARSPGDLAPVAMSMLTPTDYDPQQQQRLDERRALDDRFALKVFLDFPTKSEYEAIVVSYARRAGLDTPTDVLLAEFNVWRLRHNHDLVGGRTARDFIKWHGAERAPRAQ